MLVCHCKRVCDGAIREAVRAGARSADDVGAACRAGTGCGGCRPLVDLIIDEEAPDQVAEGDLSGLRAAS